MPRKIALGMTVLSAAVACYVTWQVAHMVQWVEGRLQPQREVDSVSQPELPMSISNTGAVLVSFDEVNVNVGSKDPKRVSTLSFKIELELFDEGNRTFLEQHQSGIRNAIIDASHRETVERLSTMAGKLYFKETLVSRINAFLNQPVVREIHFSSFLVR